MKEFTNLRKNIRGGIDADYSGHPYTLDTEEAAKALAGEFGAIAELSPDDQARKAQVEKSAANAPHKAYLLETDWYVLRYSETGKAVPGDVLTKRAAARAAIS